MEEDYFPLLPCLRVLRSKRRPCWPNEGRKCRNLLGFEYWQLARPPKPKTVVFRDLVGVAVGTLSKIMAVKNKEIVFKNGAKKCKLRAVYNYQCIIIVSKMDKIRWINIKLRCIKFSQNYDKKEDMVMSQIRLIFKCFNIILYFAQHLLSC